VIIKRLLAFLNIQMKKNDDAISVFEEIIGIAKTSDMQEELVLTLYDVGFACVKADRTSKAYEYWNELYKLDKSYRNVQGLVTLLRKEMDSDFKQSRDEFSASVDDYLEEWVTDAFPKDFLWQICGLKSGRTINIKGIMVTAKISAEKDGYREPGLAASAGRYAGNIEKFLNLDSEKFRIISNRALVKLGYKVDEILQTYREADGVDFLAYPIDSKEKILVWVRRWTKTKVGEIPLRNFAQAINDSKAKKGLFITSIELTPGGEASLENLGKVTVILPDRLGEILEGLL
jgi:tetratricopeptide (TPR) repeat protein